MVTRDRTKAQGTLRPGKYRIAEFVVQVVSEEGLQKDRRRSPIFWGSDAVEDGAGWYRLGWVDRDTLILAPSNAIMEPMGESLEELPLWDQTKYFLDIPDCGAVTLRYVSNLEPVPVEEGGPIMETLGFARDYYFNCSVGDHSEELGFCNYGADRWGYCRRHQVAWLHGFNMTGWDETEESRERNAEFLQRFELVGANGERYPTEAGGPARPFLSDTPDDEFFLGLENDSRIRRCQGLILDENGDPY